MEYTACGRALGAIGRSHAKFCSLISNRLRFHGCILREFIVLLLFVVEPHERVQCDVSSVIALLSYVLLGWRRRRKFLQAWFTPNRLQSAQQGVETPVQLSAKTTGEGKKEQREHAGEKRKRDWTKTQLFCLSG